MALHKNALIRYRTIDKCLQNPHRRWTLNDLIDACSDALYEYEGRDVNVSKRTVQLDIQMMRSDKLGYNAPIEVYDKKYYRYAVDGYSITDIPLTESDMSVLTETVEMLKQFKDFSLFAELGGIIQRLEDRVYTEKTQQAPIIHLDKNEQLKGLHYLEPLYQAILKKIVLKITYQSFTARKPSVITFHPYLLKEFNNRWFIVGNKKAREPTINLALDRIISLGYDLSATYIDIGFNGDEYYKDTIGVTVLGRNLVENIRIKINKLNAPYVITKPMHHSQNVVERFEDGSVLIELRVHINYEFERLLLGFGDALEVIEPVYLKRRMIKKYKQALANYSNN